MHENPELTIYEIAVDELVPYAGNAKMHSQLQVGQIAKSIEEFGNCDPIAVWHNSQGEPEIVEGHGRLLALKKLGCDTCPVIYLDHLTDEQRRAYTHIHNQLTLNSGFDIDVLQHEIDSLPDFEFSDFGFDITEEIPDSQPEEESKISFVEQFGVPPFSVLRASSGAWQDRKKAWLSIGIKSKTGRRSGLTYAAGLLKLKESYTKQEGWK